MDRDRGSESDNELVERAQQALPGDVRAFEELVTRHQGRVLANCRYMSGSADDAQDLAQDVFVKAFFALARFRSEATFGGWLQRIKVNHCLNFLRKQKGQQFLDVDEDVHQSEAGLQAEPAVETRIEARDQRQRIREVLDHLPATLRVPLVMRDLDGLSYQEISDELRIGLSAVKMRIKRGREEFRRLYDGLAED